MTAAADAPTLPFVHPSAIIDAGVELGPGVQVWHFCHLMPGAHIGARSRLGQNVFVGAGVVVGAGCKVQNNVSLYEGTELEDDVFCGPSCVFTNVKRPRAQIVQRGSFLPTRVRRGATLGANATIVCGVTVGEYAFVAAGAVVTHDVPAHTLVAGVPARVVGFVARNGDSLALQPDGDFRAPSGERYETDGAGGVRLVAGQDSGRT